ncbi:MAG: bile acid:sodium symporter [Steroidobacteraceae bacterium]
MSTVCNAARSQPAQIMDLKHILILSIQASVMCSVFSFGLRATAGDLLYVVQHPGLLARSLLAVFVIMPAVAVLLVRTFDFRYAVEVTLVALAISPLPPLLPKKETKAGGSAAFALGLMAWLALLSIVLIPAALKLLELYYGRELAIAPRSLVQILMMSVLLPLVAGVLVRAALPRMAQKVAGPLNMTANVLLVVGALVLLIGALPAIGKLIGQGTLVAMIIFTLAGLLTGHILALPQREHSVVLALSTACRHPAIAFAVATANFPHEPVGATVLLYLLVAGIVCVPYVLWNRQRKALT